MLRLSFGSLNAEVKADAPRKNRNRSQILAVKMPVSAAKKIPANSSRRRRKGELSNRRDKILITKQLHESVAPFILSFQGPFHQFKATQYNFSGSFVILHQRPVSSSRNQRKRQVFCTVTVRLSGHQMELLVRESRSEQRQHQIKGPQSLSVGLSVG